MNANQIKGWRSYHARLGRDIDKLSKRPRILQEQPAQCAATVSIQDVLEKTHSEWLLNDPEYRKRIRALYELK